jgi:hypothetical protein
VGVAVRVIDSPEELEILSEGHGDWVPEVRGLLLEGAG